jgi:hypothetical protein
MIAYRFNKESEIVEAVFDGAIGINELARHIMNLGNDTSLPVNLKIFTDARKAVVNFNPKSLVILIDAINSAKIRHETITEAILQNDPDITAYSFIYQKMISFRKNHIFKIFSTESAALKWLKG